MIRCCRLIGAMLFGLALGISLAGCLGEAEDDLPRQAVSGKIILDDKPLESGSITFSPVDPNQPNATSAGGAITQGAYSITQAGGPTPGKYRVAILGNEPGPVSASAEAPGPPPRVPGARVPGARSKGSAAKKPTINEKYNIRSTLTAEIKPDGSNTFDFDLKSQ